MPLCHSESRVPIDVSPVVEHIGACCNGFPIRTRLTGADSARIGRRGTRDRPDRTMPGQFRGGYELDRILEIFVEVSGGLGYAAGRCHFAGQTTRSVRASLKVDRNAESYRLDATWRHAARQTGAVILDLRPGHGESGVGVGRPSLRNLVAFPKPRRYAAMAVDHGKADWERTFARWADDALRVAPPMSVGGEWESVSDILIAYRPLANEMGFGRMIRDLENDAEHAWEAFRLRPRRATRSSAAIRSIALAQTLQQLGRYPEARVVFEGMCSMLDIGENPPRSFRDRLGSANGDAASAIFFHLDKSKSEFGKESCREHLENAMRSIRSPEIKSEFFWRHQVNALTRGQCIDLEDFEGRYQELTASGDRLASDANRLWMRSAYSLFRSKADPKHRAGHLADAIRAHREASRSSDALYDSNSHPHLTTHTMLCGLVFKLKMRQALQKESGGDDHRNHFNRYFTYIGKLMIDTGITLDGDGFRENAQVLDRFGVLEGVATAYDPALVEGGYSGEPRQDLDTIYRRVNRFCSSID